MWDGTSKRCCHAIIQSHTACKHRPCGFTILQNILNRNDKSEHITHLDNVVRIIIPWSE